MITVVGTTGSEEHKAAEKLGTMIAEKWPNLVNDNTHYVKLISAAKCIGQRRKDLDIVLFASVSQSHRFSHLDGSTQDANISNLCVVVEVKSHSPGGGLRFVGNQVEVRYRDDWENASHASHEQAISLKNYLVQHGFDKIHVVNLIWLVNCPTSQLPKGIHNILGSDAKWDHFLEAIANQKNLNRTNTGFYELRSSYASHRKFSDATDLFARVIEPTTLDRGRMEKISKSFLSDQKYSKRLGELLIIFSGRGGTGKTMRLLQFAHDRYQQEQARVLILTYNKALVADLRRLCGLMGINTRIAAPTIQIRTIYSYMYDVLRSFALIDEDTTDYLNSYERYKSELLKLIKGATYEQVEELLDVNRNILNWDYVLIDESQDWFSNERDILFILHDFRRFILADGKDQFVRRQTVLDWRESLSRRDRAENTTVVPLTKSLRLKAGLCGFVNAFAEVLGITDWDLEQVPEAYGGQVIVIEGNWLDYCNNREIHDKIVVRNREAGNQNVDMLYCVPPGLTDKERHRKYSLPASKFEGWGYHSWDGVAEDVRESCATENDQLRVVQYESCRGLEGWTVVALDLCAFYDYKLKSYKDLPDEGTLQLDYATEADKAREHAERWLMIPLTRAIDTLVIHISDRDHPVGRAVVRASKMCKDVVRWHKLA